MDFYYSSTTLQNNTEYYNMSNAEYRKLTNHIITFATTMLERGVIDGRRESLPTSQNVWIYCVRTDTHTKAHNTQKKYPCWMLFVAL